MTCDERPAEDACVYVYAWTHVHVLCVLLFPMRRGHWVPCFTSIQMTFHSIMPNVSHFIKPNCMWKNSLAVNVTFMVNNKLRSPWPQTYAYVHGIAYIYTHTWLMHVATMLQSINQFSVILYILMVEVSFQAVNTGYLGTNIPSGFILTTPFSSLSYWHFIFRMFTWIYLCNSNNLIFISSISNDKWFIIHSNWSVCLKCSFMFSSRRIDVSTMNV